MRPHLTGRWTSTTCSRGFADYARMLMAADRPGDRDRAEALLDAARALYHEVGMKSQEAKAQTVTGA
jgi:hypothetical protein